MISRKWYRNVGNLIAFLSHLAISNSQISVYVDEQPASELFALHDVLLHHFPPTLKDLAFYRHSIDRPAAIQQMSAINRIIKQLNGTRTARIESATMIIETVTHAKRLLNVIFVDGIESFR